MTYHEVTKLVEEARRLLKARRGGWAVGHSLAWDGDCFWCSDENHENEYSLTGEDKEATDWVVSEA